MPIFRLIALVHYSFIFAKVLVSTEVVARPRMLGFLEDACSRSEGPVAECHELGVSQFRLRWIQIPMKPPSVGITTQFPWSHARENNNSIPSNKIETPAVLNRLYNLLHSIHIILFVKILDTINCSTRFIDVIWVHSVLYTYFLEFQIIELFYPVDSNGRSRYVTICNTLYWWPCW